MFKIEDEFIRAYSEFTKQYFPEDALWELANYFPEKYGIHTAEDFMRNPDLSLEGARDYLQIVRSYLIYYRIPMTIESLTAAYEWGTGNLRKNGLYKAPRRVKQLIAQIRHSLQPQAEMLELNYNKE